MSNNATAVHLAERPKGYPDTSTWDVRTEELPELADGQVLVATEYISVDPAMRGWLDDAPSYIPPVEVGAVMRAAAVGRVAESKNADFPVGAHVHGMTGVRDFFVSDGSDIRVVDTSKTSGAEYLAALGLTGLTAYFGLYEYGDPQEGETVLVSGAAGAVGSVVGQLAKIRGARVVGIAGSDEKCAWLTDELGFDAAVNYKTADSLSRAIREAAPDGVDVFFDNVGGKVLDAALVNMARNARIVMCGAISDYNAASASERTGLKNYPRIITHSLRVQGFTIGDFGPRLGEGVKALAGYLSEGKLVSRIDARDALVADFPQVFDEIFAGSNTGKLMLKLPGAES
ncbi:NADP-dependent oxidoreductase [Dietzia sp.]|uniref:NADP-dependent oxidoreductase n=1 Tax=Dietzia sp. TaxID=1871616 RepID=UPI002FDA890A